MDRRISALGDSAVLVHFGDEIDLATNRLVHALDARLRTQPLSGFVESVPAYATLLVHYDALVVTYAAVVDWLRAQLDAAGSAVTEQPRRIEVPARYGGDDGPDLPSVAALHHLSAQDVVRLHTGRDYTVFMMGFTPGFPYMGKLDDALVTPRLQTPRTHVPAGSVGIAAAQTGIYPIASPGGWQIIGRTSLRLLDLAAQDPFLFAPGDTVHFVAEATDA